MTAPPAWPFGDLQPFGYSVIVADPPWNFRTWSAKGHGKSPQRHYACMGLPGLKGLPVAQLAAPDCALFLWATAPMLPQAIDVMAAWGFQYKSGAAWHKRTKNGKTAFGTGYLFRSAAEFLLLGTIGKPRAVSKRERNLIEGPVREHSRKPDEAYHSIGQLFPHGRHCDLFSREQRPGWECWGYEVGKFNADRP